MNADLLTRPSNAANAVEAAALAAAAYAKAKEPKEIRIGTLGTTLIVSVLIFLNALLMYYGAEGLWCVPPALL